MHSLQARISILTLTCIAMVALPFCLLSYAKIVEEVDELSDARLAQNARTIEALSEQASFADAANDSLLEVDSGRRLTENNDKSVQGHPYETEIGFQYWKNSNDLRLTTSDLRDLAFDAAPLGFADIRIGEDQWRVFTLVGHNDFIRAAERFDSRREIANDLLLQNTAPLLLGLPLLALLVAWAVRRGLRPLIEVTRGLELRNPDAVDGISMQGTPKEIEPMLQALNGLLHRLRRALDGERQFTENAAHELRTPLAGALVHLHNSQASNDEREKTTAICDVRGGLEHMTRIVNQMLELARWDSSLRAREFELVDLGQCVEDELMEQGLAIVEKDMEIVRTIDAEARRVYGWKPGLCTLVRNILDNALRYGFAHGRIDIEISFRNYCSLLAISNSGPGILPSQRSRMLERFSRGPDTSIEGSGLGLSIVARIAEVHGASVELSDPAHRHGLRVEVLFPPSYRHQA